jgi:hypothetical protein
MNLKKIIKKKDLYKEYIKIMNGILQLSYRESEILSLLIIINEQWQPVMSTDYKNILSTDNRKKIMSETRINKNNLSKYAAMFKNKGIIVKNDKGGFEINSKILPVIKNNIIEITFLLEIENE